jgi:hypothetical protein
MRIELEREKEERKDAEISVPAFKRQLASLKGKVTLIEADVEHYRTLVQTYDNVCPFSSLLHNASTLTLAQKRTKNAKR